MSPVHPRIYAHG